jgi:hypothetical protein
MDALANTLVEQFTTSQIYAIKYRKYDYSCAEYFADTSIKNIVDLYFAVLVNFYSSEFVIYPNEKDRHLYFNNTIKKSVLNCGHDVVSRVSCIKMFISAQPKNIKLMVPGDENFLIDMDDEKIFAMLVEATHINEKMDQQSIIANIIEQYAKPIIYFLPCSQSMSEIFVSNSINTVINYCFESIHDWFASDTETDKNELGYKLAHCGTDIKSRKILLRETTIGDENYFADSIDFQFIGSNYETVEMDDDDKLELLK